MKRIIEEVIQAEAKVSSALRQAREKASEIIHSAEKEASQKLGQAREQAREIMQASIDQARKEAECLREERIEQVTRQKDTLLTSHADVIDALVDDICKIVLNTGN
ncbi:MAG: hypothetical protein A2Z25_05975 [Planctomycetes bacterium RBG_16_55_9]|nr:MAG: hypothetical protein A2Z25_05975 [Planctomycetes bacterium RBG_16_55_9]